MSEASLQRQVFKFLAARSVYASQEVPFMSRLKMDGKVIAKEAMTMYRNAGHAEWTWERLHACHEKWGYGGCQWYPFLESPDDLWPCGDGRGIEEQLVAMEMGWV